MLCLDIFSEIQEYTILILNNLKMVECYKTIVDCIFDWGQFASADTVDSEKPNSPFTKLLDSCQLGSEQTKTIKQYKPLLGDSTRI